MRKAKKAKQRHVAIEWVEDGCFDLTLRPVEDVYVKSPNIIALPFATSDIASSQPPPPIAA